MADSEEIKQLLQQTIGREPTLISEKINGEHFSIIGAFMEGHIALHIYGDLHYVAADIFTCAENIDPDELAGVLKKFFKPDKIKSTFLKRGDFDNKDIKPKIKTSVAPLRRVRNAGAKVVKHLVRGSSGK